VFQRLGLEPSGDKGTFFQLFHFTSGVSLGKNNRLSITQGGVTQRLRLNREWRPLSFSDNRVFQTHDLVFAGYGITAPPMGKYPGYDSYQGLHVKDKWVVVFRYIPEKIAPDLRRHLNRYASIRYKVFTAYHHGAKGIMFVSGPNSNVKRELLPLSLAGSLSGSGMVAMSVSDKVIDDLLNKNTHQRHSLRRLQNKLDFGQTNVSLSLPNTSIAGQINVIQNKQYGRNVLGTLKMGSSDVHMLIVGAHVDHLGQEGGMIHPGADDNASGVASVLETAKTLCDLKAHGKLSGNKDILFAIWSGEELGLLGSAHFVNDFMKNAQNKPRQPPIEAAINLDMVGRFRQALALQAVGSSAKWPTLIKQANAGQGIPLVIQNDPYLPTDSTSFYTHGVPTLNFFTGSHDEYHTPNDTSQTLNYEGMQRISSFLMNLILVMEKQTGSITYQQVPKTGSRHGRGFRVYLGTIPDYTSPDIVGVKLAGVTKGSPAQQAGVLPGDIVLQLAGKIIHDIYDYTYVLSALSIGESVKLVVLRKNVRTDLKIIARSRD